MSCQVETGIQFLARVRKNKIKSTIFQIDRNLFPEDLKTNDIVELSGSAGCGKTTLLLNLVKNAILPEKFEEVQVNGLNATVIFIDTDLQFHFDKLTNYVRSDLVRHKDLVQHVDQIMNHSLKNFFLIRCYDSQQLLMTMDTLPETLSKHPKSIIILDGLAANYWQDQQNGGIRKMELYGNRIAMKLRNSVGDFNAVMFYTMPEYFPSTREANHFVKLDFGEGQSVIKGVVKARDNSYNVSFKIHSSHIQWLK